jgi:hypothetical protein
MYCVQLPNDVVSVGYRQTSAFKYEQVFNSPSLQFTGTEFEFLKAGHAYKYVQTSDYTRVTA